MSLASTGGSVDKAAKPRLVGSKTGSKEPINLIFSWYLALAATGSRSKLEAKVEILQLIVVHLYTTTKLRHKMSRDENSLLYLAKT